MDNSDTGSTTAVPHATRTSKIANLLERARTISQTSEPLHTHEDMLQLVRACDLGGFHRSAELQTVYTGDFFPAVKEEYTRTEDFLMERLEWSPETVKLARATGRYFDRAIPDDYVRVVQNDWPYSVPKDFEHMLIWTLLPLVDWTKADKFVAQNGIAGRVCPGRPTSTIEPPGNHTESVCEEIVEFAKARWPEASELIWLVNPVQLQTVPGLAHAHVFVRTSGS